MTMITADEAAAILRVRPKRVRELARAGKLPAVRLGRKWLFRRAELEALTGAPAAGRAKAVEISARNQLRARVTGIDIDGVMAEVRMEIGGQEMVSVITSSSVRRMGLKVGDTALAIIKSTGIMLGRAD